MDKLISDSELRVALLVCIDALEFFEKAGFTGGCTSALSQARATLLPIKTERVKYEN